MREHTQKPSLGAVRSPYIEALISKYRPLSLGSVISGGGVGNGSGVIQVTFVAAAALLLLLLPFFLFFFSLLVFGFLSFGVIRSGGVSNGSGGIRSDGVVTLALAPLLHLLVLGTLS